MHTDSAEEENQVLRFIHDEAATTDEFGGHDRVASAIAQVIREDHKLKVIGLLGPWGSGKSTVVSLVEQKLNADDPKRIKSYVFTYDAWQHQNDPPRRAFLDTLVQFLVIGKLTEDAVWREKLDRLSRKIDDTTITSTPMLTPSGKWILLSLLAVPLGNELISKTAFKSLWHVSGWTTFDGLLCAVGIALAVAPVVVALSIYGAWRTTLNPRNPIFKTWQNWTQHKSKHRDSSILSVFMNHQITTNRNRVIREPDPTAIEFQNIFREIMEAVAPVNGRHRFIFVIDNLDRLPQEDAIAMWATIRSFFLGAEETQALRKVAVSPTVLLPIDEGAVRAIFKDDTDQRASSFMDKTFDLSFRVTRPLTSQWDTYLAKKMALVFDSRMEREWPKTVSRFYLSRQTQASASPITPRSLNKLVNEVATCWLQWSKTEGISFPAIAYYCVFRQSIEANPVAAASNPLAGINELDPDWALSIAAIHYGVKLAEAKQILIEQPLRNAIQNENVTTFEDLSKIPGFDMVLLSIVERWRVDVISVPDHILLTVGLLDRVPLADQTEIKQILRLAIQSTNSWETFNAQQSKSLVSLIPDSPGPNRTAFLARIEELFRTVWVGAASKSKFSEAFAEFWIKATRLEGGTEALPSTIYVPGEGKNFFKVKLACEVNSDLNRKISTEADPAKTLLDFATDIKSTVDAALTVKTARIAMKTFQKADWMPLIQALAAYLNDQGSTAPNVSASMQILGLLRSIQPEALATTKLISANGQTGSRLRAAYEVKDDVLTGACLAILMLDEVDPVDPSIDVLADALADRPHMLELLSNNLLEYKGGNQIVVTLHSAVARNPALIGIVKRVFSYRVSIDKLGGLQVAGIVKKLDEYLGFLDANLVETFLKILERYDTFWDVMDQEPLAGNVTKIYKTLIDCGEPVQTKARQKLRERLDNVEKEAWTVAVRTGVSPYEIVTQFAALSPDSLELTTLWTPLNDMTDEVLQSTTHEIRQRWFACAALLKDSARKTLFHNVGEQITSGVSVSNVYEILELGGEQFLEEGGFAESADQSVRRVVYPSLEIQTGLEFLLRWVPSVKHWVDESRTETREQLATLLHGKQARGDAALVERFAELTESLGFPPAPLENDGDNPDSSNEGGS